MTESPISRDLQIELMKNAAERHAANAARWVGHPQVRTLLSSATSKQHEVYTYDHKMAPARAYG